MMRLHKSTLSLANGALLAAAARTRATAAAAPRFAFSTLASRFNVARSATHANLTSTTKSSIVQSTLCKRNLSVSYTRCAATSSIHDKIDEQVKAHSVVLYMKGDPAAPQCGFSRAVVQILQSGGIDFQSYNVLADEAIRQGVKDYADWPTIPQLYINGEFVGGFDIVAEMAQNGELEKLLDTIEKK